MTVARCFYDDQGKKSVLVLRFGSSKANERWIAAFEQDSATLRLDDNLENIRAGEVPSKTISSPDLVRNISKQIG